jgi:hypothetical protein
MIKCSAEYEALYGLSIRRCLTLPGQLILVAGKVPPQRRAHLRASRLSWLDVSGMLEYIGRAFEIMTEGYPYSPRVLTRLALGLQQRRAAVVQALCTTTLGDN